MMRLIAAFLLTLLPALASETNPRVTLHTSEGDIVLELDAEKAPITTRNFLHYAGKGFYDGTVFHRVISNFMIQGGGFELVDGLMREKPTDPPIHNEGDNGLKNLRGTIAMARTPELHSATSQFFINVVDNDLLNYPSYGGYAVFGKVVEGMDVVDKIRYGETEGFPEKATPVKPVVILSARIAGAEKQAEIEDRAGMTAKTRESDSLLVTKCFPISVWSQWSTGLILFMAFLLGSIPFGLMIAKSQGVNIREHGSGNIGATNVWRVLGKKFGIPCLILDMLKGMIPVVIAVNLCQIEGRAPQIHIPLPEAWIFTTYGDQVTSIQIIHILTALLAVLGHNYSPWVGFKGGKGIATSAGVLLGLMPFAVLILLALWMLLFFTTRYVSVASVGASLSLPLVTLWGSWHHGRIQDGTWNKPLFVFSVVIAVLATWKHRSNIRRLIAGTENRFTRKSKSGSDSPSDDHG